MDEVTDYNNFLSLHHLQLELCGIPKRFWPTVFTKLHGEIFDAGSSFQLIRIDYGGAHTMPCDPLWMVIATKPIDRTDKNNIFLIDHAWTFRANSIKHNLRDLPSLLERMCNLMQITCESDEEKIDKVASLVWKYARTYGIAGNKVSADERVPVWYVMDELGSGITHDDKPNFCVVPFLLLPQQFTYSLMFPIQDVGEGHTITRNFVEGYYPNHLQREAMLVPWKHYEHFHADFHQTEPEACYFIEGHHTESLPDLDHLKDKSSVKNKLKVFSEYQYINEYLTAPEFEIVDNEKDADVLWFLNHFTDFKGFSTMAPEKLINQFPAEYVITIKDLLAIVARRCTRAKNLTVNSLETSPEWLPTTFNMKTELAKLLAYYMHRKYLKLDNHWICKPYNLARGLDIHITDNLNFLCRLPLSGPKIAQKYIENPVLFERPDVGLVKFDIRYVILLRSVNPTIVYVYNNFFLRFANKLFDLTNFDDYEKHFTVMNYTEGAPLYMLLCHEFKAAWSKQYADYVWDELEKKIHEMFSDLFKAATCKEPPLGIAESPQSRALYAADLMLSWNTDKTMIQPKLLEINWMPDCQRACEYYPEFYNDIFSLLFLDKQVNSCTKIL